jgi:hypothetical protein
VPDLALVLGPSTRYAAPPAPGGYASTRQVGLGGRLSPELFPDIVLTVDDALLAR